MSKSKLLLFIVSIFVVMACPSQSSARQSRLSMAVAEVSCQTSRLFCKIPVLAMFRPMSGLLQTCRTM
jgi:hypothetical protein